MTGAGRRIRRFPRATQARVPELDDDDRFEPPAELDRIVLRQAREAIERRAARARLPGPTLGLAHGARGDLAAGLHGHPAPRRARTRSPVPEVTVQNINQQIEYPVAAPQPMGAAPAE